MPMKIMKKEIETEREIGYRYLQVLRTPKRSRRAQGARRSTYCCGTRTRWSRTDPKSDRVVLDGTLSCQAVYRQGDEEHAARGKREGGHFSGGRDSRRAGRHDVSGAERGGKCGSEV